MKTQRLLSALVVMASLFMATAAAIAEFEEVGAPVARPGAMEVLASPATQPAEPRLVETADPASRVLNEAMELQAVIWSKAKATANDYMEKSRVQIAKPDTSISDDDFNMAFKLLAEAENVLAKNENVAIPEELRELRAAAARQRAYIADKQEKVNEKRVILDKQKAEIEAAKRRDEIERQRKERIDNLMNQVLRARMENDSPTQMRLLEQVLHIDKTHRVARWMLDDAKVNYSFKQQQNIDLVRNDWERKSLLSVREAMTAYDDPIVYPAADVWHELVERRRDYAAGMPPEPPANQRTREMMEKTVPEIRFPNIGFENALTFLRDLQRININPNWAAMEAVGITKDTQISLQLRDVTFETALRELLVKAAGREGVLDYMIRDGVVKVSTVEDLESLKYILVYDVRDLLHPLTDFQVPKADRDLGGDDDDDSSGGGGGGGIFGDDDDDDSSTGQTTEQSRQEKVTSFLELLRSSVLPTSWAPQGDANVLETDGLLVVKQTSNGHRELAKLLGQLREHSRMQITIEARFLTIESQFLEDIGFDLDFIFQGGDHTSKIPVDVSTFSHGVLDKATGGFLDASGASTLLPVGSADIFDVGRSSLVVAGSFLDDIQIDFFLRATQAHRQSTRLNSLRVTLMNGHEAYVLVETQTDYVSDLTPQTAEGVVGFDPETDQLIAGISFGVRATVTADRKYVIMTVYPTLRDDTLAGTFKFQTGPSTSTPTSTTGTTSPIFGGTVFNFSAAQEAEIQLRRAAIQEVRTTVMVPDKGTLVLGGQRIADELEVETGVPILSKIPIIKRAFTTRTFVKRERTLLILIRPQILIPEELEP